MIKPTGIIATLSCFAYLAVPNCLAQAAEYSLGASGDQCHATNTTGRQAYSAGSSSKVGLNPARYSILSQPSSAGTPSDFTFGFPTTGGSSSVQYGNLSIPGTGVNFDITGGGSGQTSAQNATYSIDTSGITIQGITGNNNSSFDLSGIKGPINNTITGQINGIAGPVNSQINGISGQINGISNQITRQINGITGQINNTVGHVTATSGF